MVKALAKASAKEAVWHGDGGIHGFSNLRYQAVYKSCTCHLHQHEPLGEGRLPNPCAKSTCIQKD